MKEDIKFIKAELKYIISSIEGWGSYNEAYNYETVHQTLDRVKEQIIKLKETHFEGEKK